MEYGAKVPPKQQPDWPESIWLRGDMYEKTRTTAKDPEAVEYVQATAYNNLLAWTQKQVDASDDTARLDWLSDRENDVGNVQLPTECINRNLHSLRDAIDDAMNLPSAT